MLGVEARRIIGILMDHICTRRIQTGLQSSTSLVSMRSFALHETVYFTSLSLLHNSVEFMPLTRCKPLGTAIYFLSPLWPYNVTTFVSLDSSPPFRIDLVDYSRPNVGQGGQTVSTGVRWKAEGLFNTLHTLKISVGKGERFAIVDGLM
jgi:hypothetical protein